MRQAMTLTKRVNYQKSNSSIKQSIKPIKQQTHQAIDKLVTRREQPTFTHTQAIKQTGKHTNKATSKQTKSSPYQQTNTQKNTQQLAHNKQSSQPHKSARNQAHKKETNNTDHATSTTNHSAGRHSEHI